MEPTCTTVKTDRVVRVFISSTFRDMHAEREELVKFTFPELRRRCRERQVDFVGVDLRWGRPDERKAEGKILPICLAEIERRSAKSIHIFRRWCKVTCDCLCRPA